MSSPSRDRRRAWPWLVALAVSAVAACSGPKAETLPNAAPKAGSQPVAPARELRVCADPNNLPFSNDRLEGSRLPPAERLHEEVDRLSLPSRPHRIRPPFIDTRPRDRVPIPIVSFRRTDCGSLSL